MTIKHKKILEQPSARELLRTKENVKSGFKKSKLKEKEKEIRKNWPHK